MKHFFFSGGGEVLFIIYVSFMMTPIADECISEGIYFK